MNQFARKMAENSNLSLAAQKSVGIPRQDGTLGDDHKHFLETLLRMIETKEIDLNDPQSFLKKEIYDPLDQQWKDRADLALMNIASQLHTIYDYYKSAETPNESLQLQSMVEHLWQMKQKIENHIDVFKF